MLAAWLSCSAPALLVLRPVARPAARHRSTRPICSSETTWSADEDWALADGLAGFTAGRGDDNAATFWTALAASSAVLGRRSGSECYERTCQLAREQNLTQAFGPEPQVLDSWSRLPDGRFTGTVDGRSVWLTVEAEARLASDPRSTAGYVETLAGRIYELGRPDPTTVATPAAAAALPEAPASGTAASQPGTTPALLSFALAGSVGFILGSQLFVVEWEDTPQAGAALPAAQQQQQQQQLPTPAAVPATPRAEKVSLTLAEQLARQQIRVDADQMRLDAMRSDLRVRALACIVALSPGHRRPQSCPAPASREACSFSDTASLHSKTPPPPPGLTNVPCVPCVPCVGCLSLRRSASTRRTTHGSALCRTASASTRSASTASPSACRRRRAAFPRASHSRSSALGWCVRARSEVAVLVAPALSRHGLLRLHREGRGCPGPTLRRSFCCQASPNSPTSPRCICDHAGPRSTLGNCSDRSGTRRRRARGAARHLPGGRRPGRRRRRRPRSLGKPGH